MNCNSFLEGKLEKISNIINALDDAILQLAINGVESYKLDTGQGSQSVTKLDLLNLEKTRESLYNQYVTVQARLNGCGVTRVIPRF